MKTAQGVAVALLMTLAGARAEEIVFFKSSQAGPDAWSWAGARAKAQGAELRVVEANPAGDYGDVYVADRLPYVEGGVIRLDVAAVEKGTYTLQVLGFRGESHDYTVEPLKDLAATGPNDVSLPVEGLGADSDSLLLKLWVGGAEGAATRVRDLIYSADVDVRGALLDDRFAAGGGWQSEPDRLAVAYGPAGASLQLQGAHTFAPLARPGSLSLTRAHLAVLHVASVEGTVTLQMDAFDATGTFLGAVDVIKDAVAGWHAVSLSAAKWPDGAVSFAPKLWLGGNAGARAIVDRLLVTAR